MFPSPELAVVVPTFNARGQIDPLIERLAAALAGIAWEVVVVDDNSPDGTAAAVRALARQDPRVRVVQRIGRRGLASACVEGMLACAAPYLAVLESDQAPAADQLPALLRAVQSDGLDLAVGSRYLGAVPAAPGLAGRVAARLSRLVLKVHLTDPMSGVFVLTREVLDGALGGLSGIGVKVLPDLFASNRRPLRFTEVPYGVRPTGAGGRDTNAIWDYLMMFLDKTLGRYVPIRFIPFALVGGTGVLVHLLVLWLVYDLGGSGFATAQSAAAAVAMTFNFFINNAFTYRDRQLRGWGLLRGWFSYTLACSLGVIANVGIATYAFETHLVGATAWVLSAVAGILVGAVWNYAVTSVYTWNKVRGD
ncbi:glycosyltransferase [uncultured Thiodictyon sp.]|uniref:glycosyltransferase n=1 Tax=uncultured Thiodictyon sp. TaxID=1846217 RepID=UPI0025D67814|nr:glycosyltransferase [uncultured Thiodictyon sp.]